jgi:very-short-patch-repair endonuclease
VLFTRDCIIGDQIIELCSRQHKIAVELDMPKAPTLEDEARMEILRDRGYRVVHVTSAEIYKDPYEVACRIVSAAQENHRRAVRRSIARLAV